MFSHIIISCACDMHLKLEIFNLTYIKQVAKLFDEGIISLVALCFKIERIWNFNVIFFSSNWHNEYVVV
jgi:hypothetical protein